MQPWRRNYHNNNHRKNLVERAQSSAPVLLRGSEPSAMALVLLQGIEREGIETMSDYRTGSAAGGPAMISEGHSAISWGAVIAGAFAATAMMIVLFALGSGLGFAMVSPWGDGPSATTVGWITAVWAVVVEIISFATGGYVAARMRRAYPASVHTNEIALRDGMHGFVVWAFAVVVSAWLIGGAAAGLVSGVARTGTSLATGAATGAMQNRSDNAPGAADVTGYFVDSLFRTSQPRPEDLQSPQTRAEIGRIMANAVATGQLTPEDRTYVAQAVAARTGLSQADAETRVNATMQKMQNAAKQTADTAAKIGAYASFWTFMALIVAAAAASWAAALGGRHRDG